MQITFAGVEPSVVPCAGPVRERVPWSLLTRSIGVRGGVLRAYAPEPMIRMGSVALLAVPPGGRAAMSALSAMQRLSWGSQTAAARGRDAVGLYIHTTMHNAWPPRLGMLRLRPFACRPLAYPGPLDAPDSRHPAGAPVALPQHGLGIAPISANDRTAHHAQLPLPHRIAPGMVRSRVLNGRGAA